MYIYIYMLLLINFAILSITSNYRENIVSLFPFLEPNKIMKLHHTLNPHVFI